MVRSHIQIQSSKRDLDTHESVALWLCCVEHVVYIFCSD